MSLLADVVRWCRREAVPLSGEGEARTRILKFLDSAEGSRYLRMRGSQLQHLEAQEDMDDANAADIALLAAIRAATVFSSGASDVYAQKDLAAAALLFEKAAGLAEDNEEREAWLLESARVKRQSAAFGEAHERRYSSPPSPSTGITTPIRVVDGSTLDTSTFRSKFEKEGVPVIFRGLATELVGGGGENKGKGENILSLLSLSSVRSALRGRRVQVRRHVEGSRAWARLEPVPGSVAIEELIRVGASKAQGEEESAKTWVQPELYLHDLSLPLNCPALLDAVGFRIPKYFSDDRLRLAREVAEEAGCCDVMYTRSWPSLFVGAKGTRSDVHVDAARTSFWMALFQGRKEWTVWRAEDAPLLGPRYHEGSLDPVFAVEVQEGGRVRRSSASTAAAAAAAAPSSAPAIETAPVAAAAALPPHFQAVLEPGDVIFIPSGCPHHVRNVEDTVAISANVIGEANAAAAEEELSVLAISCPRSRELRAVLRSEQLKARLKQQREERGADQEDEHRPWRE